MAVFHAVSAFCNAGFDIFGDSLVPFQLNPVITLTIAFLIILGGLGFGVYLDVFSRKKNRVMTLHTKLVLMITAGLLISGTVFFFLLEDRNPETMLGMPVWSKWMAAFFQSVTTRTAGYYSIPQGGIYEVSAMLTIFLMFIGGSPAFRRSISSDVVMRALAIIMIALGWVVFVSTFLAFHENAPYVTALYETVSAFATVGLTIDFTPDLSTVSKALLSLTMYMGRVGPVTLAYALIKRRKPKDSVNAYGNVMVG